MARWDTNNDGLIDQSEYRVYYLARLQQGFGDGPNGMQQANPVTILIEEDLDTRPVVLRAGKLPKDKLPRWFFEYDTDEDGQVALYEWRKAGKSLDEFKEWDRDDDGFITAQELTVDGGRMDYIAHP